MCKLAQLTVRFTLKNNNKIEKTVRAEFAATVAAATAPLSVMRECECANASPRIHTSTRRTYKCCGYILSSSLRSLRFYWNFNVMVVCVEVWILLLEVHTVVAFPNREKKKRNKQYASTFTCMRCDFVLMSQPGRESEWMVVLNFALTQRCPNNKTQFNNKIQIRAAYFLHENHFQPYGKCVVVIGEFFSALPSVPFIGPNKYYIHKCLYWIFMCFIEFGFANTGLAENERAVAWCITTVSSAKGVTRLRRVCAHAAAYNRPKWVSAADGIRECDLGASISPPDHTSIAWNFSGMRCEPIFSPYATHSRWMSNVCWI